MLIEVSNLLTFPKLIAFSCNFCALFAIFYECVFIANEITKPMFKLNLKLKFQTQIIGTVDRGKKFRGLADSVDQAR